MGVSQNINQYIENSKLRRTFLKWKKSQINVFITPISTPVKDKEFLYSRVREGMNRWNAVLRANSFNLFFNETTTPVNADIVVHWTKVGRVFEGMCKYPGVINDELKKVSIEIGLPNEFSGKNTTEESIFFVIMHEFGHSLGLGHGIEPDDLMFVPHQKNITTPSQNDIYVLKQIYNM